MQETPSWFEVNAADLNCDQLREFSRDALRYEADMLLWATERLHQPGPLPTNVRNAVIEAVYVHGRCLFYFLRPPMPKRGSPGEVENRDSVHACHYTENWKLNPVSEAWYFVGRGSKWVAHLSTNRLVVDGPDKAIHWPGVEQVWEEFQRFVMGADPERVHPDLRTLALRPLPLTHAEPGAAIGPGPGTATTNTDVHVLYPRTSTAFVSDPGDFLKGGGE